MPLNLQLSLLGVTLLLIRLELDPFIFWFVITGIALRIDANRTLQS